MKVWSESALDEYISARVVADGGCLRWQGWFSGGHPSGRLAGRVFLVRRAVYETKRGPIPAGRVIWCMCGTPDCVSQEHFRLTTRKSVALECGALGLMSGPVRSARIAAVKRASHQSKISQADADAIRTSTETLKVLAERYGLSESTCSRIKRHRMRREFGANPWMGLEARSGLTKRLAK